MVSFAERLRLSPTNPMNKALVSLLVFQVIVFWLAFPGMLLVSSRGLAISLGVTAAASLLALVASLTLKRPYGYPLGWLTQLVGIALGLLTSMMFVVGIVFAVIWVTSFVLGRKIEAAQTAL